MAEPILEIIDLDVSYMEKNAAVQAVRRINLTVKEGENLGVIGESGSGKSTLAAAIMRSESDTRRASGRILYRGTDILSLSEKEFSKYRWTEIAMVFQNSLDILNPVMTIGDQIGECVRKHLALNKAACEKRVAEVLQQVCLSESAAALLPHQLSGGMRQRALVAMAISCRPKLLIADEPTSAVDEENKREIISLLLRLREELDLTLIVISHEIQTIAAAVNKIAVMYGGCMMEYGTAEEILYHARHTYTRGLLSSSPQINPYRDLWGIAEGDGSCTPEGCPFLCRCPQRAEICSHSLPELQPLEGGDEHQIACHCGGIVPLLEVEKVSKHFQNGKTRVCACDDCSFKIYYGEVVSVVGKSGAGKSTLAMICAGIEEADLGEVSFLGKPLKGNSATSVKGGIQIIFQDPFSSVNGRMTVFSAISEPLRVLKTEKNPEQTVQDLLRDVGLPTDRAFLARPCHTLSGGQRQRVSIARALAMKPRLLIADEICSMLDSSTQANLLRLLKSLQQKNGLGLMFITHDELLSRKIADRVLRVENGRLTEVNDSLIG